MSLAQLEGRKNGKGEGPIERYESLRDSFAPWLDVLRRVNVVDTIVPPWDDLYEQLEKDFFPYPPVDFLGHSFFRERFAVSRDTMAAHLEWLRTRRDPDWLADTLQEDSLGMPRLVSDGAGPLLTSGLLVEQLFHLLRFSEATGAKLSETQQVVEWGGGYGAFAKVFRRGFGGHQTQIIFDVPVLSCLQWLYLSCVFSPEETKLLHREDPEIAPGKVNLVPIYLASQVRIQPNLFVSPWGLSEHATPAQIQAVHRNWWGAPSLLLGVRHTDWLERVALSQGAVSEVVCPTLPGRRYLFR